MPAAPLTDTEKTEVCALKHEWTFYSFLQRLKSALWYSIGATIDAIALEQDINATPQFIGALTELVWNQIREIRQNNLEYRSMTESMQRTLVKT